MRKIEFIKPSIRVNELLNQLKDMKYNEYVFFSTTSKSGHIGGVRKTWDGILKRAGISNFHLHDLRHTYATALLAKALFRPCCVRSVSRC